MSAYVPFNERKHRVHRKLVDAAASNGRILEVGCSSGYLTERLVANGNTVVGIEYDAEAAREAEAHCERVLVGDIETMVLPDERFDVILCGDVIEHLRDPQAALARLRPLLQPGGRLVVSTPNVANWAIRLSLLAGRWQYADRGILDRTHTRLFTLRSLVETIEAAGYRVSDIDFSAPAPGDSDAIDGAARAVARLRPTLFAYQWVITAS
jgi:SAM-dependent methyltransferase